MKFFSQYHHIKFVFLLVLSVGVAFDAAASPQLETRLKGFVNGRVRLLGKNAQVGISVREAGGGAEIFSYSGKQLMIPASVLKIFTTFAALKILGSEFSVPTEVFFDKERNLYVRGYGDPSFVEENLWWAARSMKAQGVESIENLVVDDSLFVNPTEATGPRSYQAGTNAVSLNHNSYAIRVFPAAAGEKAHISLTDGLGYQLLNNVITKGGTKSNISLNESPLPGRKTKKETTLLALEEPVKKVNVSGHIGEGAEPVTMYRTVPSGSAYFAGVFRSILQQVGVVVHGGLYVGKTPPHARQLLLLRSKELNLIVRDVNHFSNNFIAEQLVYLLGETESGRFDHAIGLKRLGEFVSKMLGERTFILADGSGLSRESRVSAAQLTKMLALAYQDFSLAPDFISSLSRFGHSGTLKKRKIKHAGATAASQGDSIWAKTGTLTGVSSLSGYAMLGDGQRVSFAIIINGNQSLLAAKKFHTDFLSALTGELH